VASTQLLPGTPRRTASLLWFLVVVPIGAALAAAWFWQPVNISDFYFAKQDLPVLCAMVVAGLLIAHLRIGGRWEREIVLPARTAAIGAALLLVVGIAGYWLVMMAYDFTRDQAMATFAAKQIAGETLITQVPQEWQPYGHAMMPQYFFRRFSPELAWSSAYLPVNSAFQTLGAIIGHRSVANPLLLVAGLLALWNVARRIWPERRDVAVVAVLLGATSAQLIANAMTSFAMVGHFALNMVWLALFLRNDRWGVAGALAVGFLASGLHQYHFHPMFAGPFLLWLLLRRNWSFAAVYALGYAAIVLFWARVYPEWLQDQGGAAAIGRPLVDMSQYLKGRGLRLFSYSWTVWSFNFVRFFTWQNLALVPLLVGAGPVLWRRQVKLDEPFLPLLGACAIGLVFLVFQGHGFGYRYLSGVIGCFCLLAGYGWARIVPAPGSGRPWAMLKLACCFTVLFAVPLQLVMARSMVAPHARLYHEAMAANVDIVVVDTEGGFIAQDIVQNGPNFAQRPKLMDLSFISAEALERLCRTKTMARIDRRHFRAVGMRESGMLPRSRQLLAERRALLEDSGCAPLLDPESDGTPRV